MKKSFKNIWWWRKKCIPLHSLSGSKRASKERRQAGNDAEWSCYAADAGHDTDTDRNSETRVTQKSWRRIWKLQIFFLPLQSFPPHENRRPTGNGKRGREIPEDIERLTIDKDKKVQELIKWGRHFSNGGKPVSVPETDPDGGDSGGGLKVRDRRVCCHVLKQKK